MQKPQNQTSTNFFWLISQDGALKGTTREWEGLQPMLLIFQRLCAHKIAFVQQFTRTHLYMERRVWNICKKPYWKEHLCTLIVFLCALVSQPVRARTRAQLKGNTGCNSGLRFKQRRIWRTRKTFQLIILSIALLTLDISSFGEQAIRSASTFKRNSDVNSFSSRNCIRERSYNNWPLSIMAEYLPSSTLSRLMGDGKAFWVSPRLSSLSRSRICLSRFEATVSRRLKKSV